MKMNIFNKVVVLTISLSFCACASTPPQNFENEYSRNEIAMLTAQAFDVGTNPAAKALKPVYKKYGAPQAYITGNMSTTHDNAYSRLYGSGDLRVKRRLPEHRFWQIEGEELYQLDMPIPTVHLVYEIAQLDDLKNKLTSIGQLSKHDETFTIFERRVAEQIIITVHRSKDIPKNAILSSLLFYQF